MTGAQGESTFWRFTACTAKKALQLYFEPVFQLLAWLQPEHLSTHKVDILRHEVDVLNQDLRDLERRVYASPDSLSGLELRLLRLQNLPMPPAFAFRVEWAQDQLAHAARWGAGTREREELLRAVRHEVRRVEEYLDFDEGHASGAGAD